MKVVVFAPHAATWVHAFPEAVVAEALARAGHEILYVTCDRILGDYCVAMMAAGVPFEASGEERRAVCDACQARARLLREQFAFGGQDLGSWLRPGDEDAVSAVVDAASRSDPAASVVDGVPVGRFALYQLLIRRKRMDLVFSDNEWAEFKVQLASTTRAALALARVFAAERPDRVLLYNGLYSVNLACRYLADRVGVPTYFLHAGGNLARRRQTLMVGRDHTFRFYPALVKRWPRYRDRPIPPELASAIGDHFVELFTGRSGFVYSSAKSPRPMNLRERFGIPERARILVATLSSYDEQFAAESVGARVQERAPVFPTQADWIRATADFVGSRRDLFLLVRVHPREFPNRRDAVRSQHADLLRNVLSSLPQNMRVNWPDDGISLYELADYADVFLNSWSSAGKEMSLLGCPVVTYAAETLFYPPDLNYAASSREHYFELIEHALADGWRAERITAVFRWLAVEYGYALLDIGDAYAERETACPPLLSRAWRRARRMLDPLYAERSDCKRRPAAARAAPLLVRLIESGADTLLDVLREDELGAATPAQEAAAIRSQIGRLIPYLYPGRSGAAPGTLHARLTEFAA